MTKLYQLTGRTVWFDPTQVESIIAQMGVLRIVMRTGCQHVWEPDPPEGADIHTWDLSPEAAKLVCEEADRVRNAVAGLWSPPQTTFKIRFPFP